MTYVLLIVGFLLLIKGADFFVDGSSSIARLLKVPSVVIGLTIVAMGTSAPEAAVSITAGFAGNNDIALSNIIGSNIFNLLIVVGLSAMIFTVPTDVDILKRDLPVNVGVTLLLLFFLSDLKISRPEGLTLTIGMIFYVVLLVRNAMRNRTQAPEESRVLTPRQSILAIAGGLLAIVLGGKLVVSCSSEIAAAFGLSQNLIGLTIVAVGTSLPELVTSMVASRKGESGLALGNAVGSCIFNILFILGVSSMLTPLTAKQESLVDCIVLLAITAAMFFFGKTCRKTSRAEGAVCVLAYIGYMAYIILR